MSEGNDVTIYTSGAETDALRPGSGLSATKLMAATRQLAAWVEHDDVPSVNARVLWHGRTIARLTTGTASWHDGLPGFDDCRAAPDTLYCLASISKPVTASAVMLLLQDGALLLDEPVSRYLPDIEEHLLVRHLLTHTSGLPDMLPENAPLRQRHADLDAFVAATCRTPLLFPAGTCVSYSSMGILLLARIIELIVEQSLQTFLERRLFQPLGLRDVTYRPSEAQASRVARLRLLPGEDATDWDNNSAYWRGLGAPWGGLYATADDIARLGQFFLEAGWADGPGRELDLLSPAVVRLMTRQHTRGLPAVEGNVDTTWGLGWALGARWMGDLATQETFGHAGDSGTMLWIDPSRQLVCCVVTNKRTEWIMEWRRFAGFSTALMAAIPLSSA